MEQLTVASPKDPRRCETGCGNNRGISRRRRRRRRRRGRRSGRSGRSAGTLCSSVGNWFLRVIAMCNSVPCNVGLHSLG